MTLTVFPFRFIFIIMEKEIEDIDFSKPLGMIDIFNSALILNVMLNKNEPEILNYAEKNILQLKERYQAIAKEKMEIIRKSRSYKKIGKTCPVCNTSLYVIRKGFDNLGKKKYLCRNCKKNFH